MKYKYRKAAYIYLTSCKNEIYLDRIGMELTNLSTSIDFEIIRPFTLKKYIVKYKFIGKIILSGIIFFWGIINCLFAFVQLIKSLFHKIFTSGILLIESEIIVDLTPLLVNRLQNIKNVPKYRITKLTTNRKNNVYSIYHFLTFNNLLNSFILSCISPFFISKIEKQKVHRLQTYTSFSWYITWFAINNISPKEIWFGNHFDRWAILVDNIGYSNTLIQHGIEDGSFSPPVKLHNIKTMYLYNYNQAQFFYDKILDCMPKIRIFEPKLTLSKIDKNCFSILIIGNIAVYSQIEYLLIEKMFNFGYCIFLKPHPRQSISQYKLWTNSYQFELITDPYYFPDVDVVISYNSTLALEYELMGKTVLYHTDLKFEELLNKIIR